MNTFTKLDYDTLIKVVDCYRGWQYKDFSYYKARDMMMIKFAYFLGLRKSEVAFASVYFLDRLNKTYTVSKHVAKNNRDRIIPIPDKLFPELIAYVETYSLDNWLFLSRKKLNSKHLCPRCVGFRFEKYRKLAGLEQIRDFSKDGKILHKLRFHDLRSTYATRLDRKGVRLKIIQNLLGHLHLSSTERYLSDSSIEERREAVNLVF